MSDRDLSLNILDIMIAVDRIKRYTKQFSNSEELMLSELEWDATLRELQIIGDAVNTLLRFNVLDPSYRRIVDFRNQITMPISV